MESAVRQIVSRLGVHVATKKLVSQDYCKLRNIDKLSAPQKKELRRIWNSLVQENIANQDTPIKKPGDFLPPTPGSTDKIKSVTNDCNDDGNDCNDDGNDKFPLDDQEEFEISNSEVEKIIQDNYLSSIKDLLGEQKKDDNVIKKVPPLTRTKKKRFKRIRSKDVMNSILDSDNENGFASPTKSPQRCENVESEIIYEDSSPIRQKRPSKEKCGEVIDSILYSDSGDDAIISSEGSISSPSTTPKKVVDNCKTKTIAEDSDDAIISSEGSISSPSTTPKKVVDNSKTKTIAEDSPLLKHKSISKKFWFSDSESDVDENVAVNKIESQNSNSPLVKRKLELNTCDRVDSNSNSGSNCTDNSDNECTSTKLTGVKTNSNVCQRGVENRDSDLTDERKEDTRDNVDENVAVNKIESQNLNFPLVKHKIEFNTRGSNSTDNSDNECTSTKLTGVKTNSNVCQRGVENSDSDLSDERKEDTRNNDVVVKQCKIVIEDCMRNPSFENYTKDGSSDKTSRKKLISQSRSRGSFKRKRMLSCSTDDSDLSSEESSSHRNLQRKKSKNKKLKTVGLTDDSNNVDVSEDANNVDVSENTKNVDVSEDSSLSSLSHDSDTDSSRDTNISQDHSTLKRSDVGPASNDRKKKKKAKQEPDKDRSKKHESKELKNLRAICRHVGVILRNTIELKGCDTDDEKIKRIKTVLREKGMKGRPSMKSAEQFNLERELRELGVVNSGGKSKGHGKESRRRPCRGGDFTSKSSSPPVSACDDFSHMKDVFCADDMSD